MGSSGRTNGAEAKVRVSFITLTAFIRASVRRAPRGRLFLPTGEPPGRGAPVRFEVTLTNGSTLCEGSGKVEHVTRSNPAAHIPTGIVVVVEHLHGESQDVMDTLNDALAKQTDRSPEHVVDPDDLPRDEPTDRPETPKKPSQSTSPRQLYRPDPSLVAEMERSKGSSPKQSRSSTTAPLTPAPKSPGPRSPFPKTPFPRSPFPKKPAATEPFQEGSSRSSETPSPGSDEAEEEPIGEKPTYRPATSLEEFLQQGSSSPAPDEIDEKRTSPPPERSDDGEEAPPDAVLSAQSPAPQLVVLPSLDTGEVPTPAASPAPELPMQQPSVVERPSAAPERSLSSPPRKSRVRRWVMVSAIIVGLVGGAIAALLVTQYFSSSSDAQFILVEGDVQREETHGSKTTKVSGVVVGRDASAPDASVSGVAPALDADVASEGPSKAAPQGDASTSEAGPSGQISEELARHRRRIERCVSGYARTKTSVPEFTIELAINTEGLVDQLSLEPAELGGTELSACLTSVARMMRFGPQSSDVVIRIPIRARRAQ